MTGRELNGGLQRAIVQDFYYDKKGMVFMKCRIVSVLASLAVFALIGTACKPSGGTSSGTAPGTDKDDFYSDLQGTTLRLASESALDDLTEDVIDEFETKYGCTVEFENYGGEWSTKIYQLINSGNPPDTMIVTDNTYLTYLARNMMEPLDGLYDPSDPIWNPDMIKNFQFNGKTYGVARQDEDYIFYIYFNQTMFENAGEKTPAEYAAEGNWNFDTFTEVAAKFVKDTDNDGISNQRGYGTWYWDLFIFANGGRSIEIGENGSIELTLDHPNELKGLQMMQDLQNKYRSFDHGQPYWREDFMAGNVAMIAERPWQAMGSYDVYNNVNFEIGIAPFPLGPDADENTAPAMLYAWGVPAGAKNAKGAVAWYRFQTEYNTAHANDPVVVNNRNRTYKDGETYAYIKEFNRTHIPNGSFIYGLPDWWSQRWILWEDIFNNGVPPATAVASHRSFIESKIKSITDLLNTAAS